MLEMRETKSDTNMHLMVKVVHIVDIALERDKSFIENPGFVYNRGMNKKTEKIFFLILFSSVFLIMMYFLYKITPHSGKI